MRKPARPITAQQHSNWSAAFLLAAVICTAIVFGQGDAAKAVAMIFTFILGALCASHGAKGREKKLLEAVGQTAERLQDDMKVYRKYLAEKREKQKQE